MKPVTKYILIGLLVSFVVFLLWYFKSIVTYVIISAILALIGGPLVTLITRIRIGRYRPSRSFGAAVTLVFLWVLIFSFFSVFIPTVARETNELSKIDVKMVMQNLNGPIERVQDFVGQTSNNEDFLLSEYAAEKIVSVIDVSQVSQYLSGFASMLGDIVIAIFSISFMTFFFLKEERVVGDFIVLLVPSKYTSEVTHIVQSASKLLKRYFIGIGIEVLSVAVLVGIGLSIVGLKFSHVMLIASFAGIINVIPYIGPIIGSLFGVVFVVATHLGMTFYPDLAKLVGVVALVFLVVQIIDNILFQPLIYSSSVNAHPLEIFLVILVAGTLAGIVGMVMAIPAYTILRVIAKEFFNSSRLVKKLTSKMAD